MKLNLFFVGITLLSLASCTNLGSFHGSYESLCSGKKGVTEFDVCTKGRKCFESSSLLVIFPRVFGTEGYENYLARYTATTLTLHEGTYRELKNKYFSPLARQQRLAHELMALSISPAIQQQKEAKERIERELDLLRPVTEDQGQATSAAPAQLPTAPPTAAAPAAPEPTATAATARDSKAKSRSKKDGKTRASESKPKGDNKAKKSKKSTSQPPAKPIIDFMSTLPR